ncbi:hypothetical protein [Salinibacter ruber]|uniref:Uncharacterized protein n=1 Tax=Salinibacter ruber TaxID=146919 RepID=A0A9X2Q4S9_9BACT|nr:hypothetical protein [Salinibacter ruber]MCS3661795.1 hypothetical protein [Salinibacter ruber]MCS3711544.1 hypothetical protein [Salinibacter ruber]
MEFPPPKVDVYRNLKTGGFSIRSRDPDHFDGAYGRVVAHCKQALVGDVEFVVQQGARERAVEEGQRSVHAFVRGVLIGSGELPSLSEKQVRHWNEVTYNPFEQSDFVMVGSEEPVFTAPLALLGQETAWIPDSV